MKIPDEVVRKAWEAWGANIDAGWRAALQVAAVWAMEEAAKIADSECQPGEDPEAIATAVNIAETIRARKEEP